MSEHFRKFAILYGLAIWTVIGMFAMGGHTVGLNSEYARVLK